MEAQGTGLVSHVGHHHQGPQGDAASGLKPRGILPPACCHQVGQLPPGQPALHQVDFSWEGYQWIDFHDVDNTILSFMRRARDASDFVIVVANFTPVPREGYRVGVPKAGFYREILNSDAACFGGSNLGNAGGLPSDPMPWQGQPHSILLTVPPLAVVYFKPE